MKNPSIDPALSIICCQHPDERDEIRPARPAVDQSGERRPIPARIEAAYVGRRMRTHDREETLNRLEHAGDAPERQRTGAEADDFAIVGPFEPPHDLDRIGGRIRVVEALVETIELGFQRANRHPGSQV